ncbi:DUF4352 domain-containing protein [Bacillus idriensis]|uniref:DUF4352 domain-containing protein n=1 Tax=Metabacillus idriensis TaxID=324768 RepID=A0A6I2MHY1_9BACI|nr:DUF4352 domain-containing protein [Metabacillus idriensis]MRX56101.1 DUF4352 domain-containing protein [Metabacillus idriensis]
MKQLWMLLSLTLILSACSAQASSTPEDAAKEEKEKVSETTSDKQTSNDVYVPNPQITDDRKLLEVGQSYKDAKGAAELKAIKNVNKTYKVGDAELIVHDVKIIEHTPDYSMIDFFHTFTHEETFDIVKANIEIKNTSDQPVYFSPIAVLETNTGEHKDWESDIYLEELNGKLAANSSKKGNVGFILDHSDKEVKSIKILTSDLLNDKQKVAAKAQELNIEFE